MTIGDCWQPTQPHDHMVAFVSGRGHCKSRVAQPNSQGPSGAPLVGGTPRGRLQSSDPQFHETDVNKTGSKARFRFMGVSTATVDDLTSLFEARGGPKHCWCMLWRSMPSADPSRQAAVKSVVRPGTPERRAARPRLRALLLRSSLQFANGLHHVLLRNAQELAMHVP